MIMSRKERERTKKRWIEVDSGLRLVDVIKEKAREIDLNESAGLGWPTLTVWGEGEEDTKDYFHLIKKNL